MRCLRHVFFVFLFSFCLQTSRVYQAGTRGEKNLPSGMGMIGKRERDGRRAALILAISVLASVPRVPLLRDVRNIVGNVCTN